MDTADLDALVDELSGNIDDLEEALTPLLKSGLSQSTSKLPLLDKAKAYVFTTYAIESILISYLRLNGVDGKSHPIYQEMARVKEYNAKIKAAETGGAKRNTTLNREAANRMIKHGLAGNDKHDLERAQRAAAEKAGAKRKLEDMHIGTHTRFEGAAKRMKANEANREVVEVVQATEAGTSDEEDAAAALVSRTKRRQKKRNNDEVNEMGGARVREMGQANDAGAGPRVGNESIVSSELDHSTSGIDGASGKKKKKGRRQKNAERMENGRAEEMM